MEPKRYGSGYVDIAPLAQPIKFSPSGAIAKNRFMKAPMGEYLASWNPRVPSERGVPTEELVELYRRWGEGENGWGLIVTGNVDTHFESVSAAGNMSVTTECKPEGTRFDMFGKVAAAGKANGSLMVAQVTHPGRQLQHRLYPIAVAPSAIQMEPKNGVKYAKPHAATQEEIDALIEGFAYAAGYLEKAGFDGIEIHAANGYLISEFLSRATNKRTDKYGPQTITSRLQFITEITQAVKARVSAKFIVGAKLNSVEFQDGGVTPQEAQELCQALEKMGIDFVELSGGTQENLGMQWTKDSTRRREAFFLEFAKIITDALGPATKLKVYLTGGFRSAEGMVKGLSVVHGIGLGRPAAAEPRLCRDILEGRVYGAAKPAEAMENDIWGGIAVAAAQMAQIANGKEPLDTSNAQVMDILKADIAQWQKQTLEDGEKLEYIRSVRYSGPQQPYRTTSK